MMFEMADMRSLVAPIPVDPVNSWVDVLGVFAGAIGAVLAAIAVWFSFRQAAIAKKDLVQERRLQFDLGLLVEIRRQMGTTAFGHLAGYVGALIRDPNDESDVPLLRAVIGVKQGPKGTAKKKEIVGNQNERSWQVEQRLTRAVEDEIDEAISKRFHI